MITITDVVNNPKMGILVLCLSERWDKMSKSEVEKELSPLKEITVEGQTTEIIDCCVCISFSGRICVSFSVKQPLDISTPIQIDDFV